jgi:hypothetical protein
MTKSFDELVKRTTSKKTQERAARRAQELVSEAFWRSGRYFPLVVAIVLFGLIDLLIPSVSKVRRTASLLPHAFRFETSC